MENDNAKIIALALGIPSATFFSLALLIAISFHYSLVNRIGRQRTTPTVLPLPPTMSMPSRSSSSHPESLHPYRDTRSQSTTSLETIGKKSWVSRLIPKIWREGLLPLPEGTRLSSNPPELPAMPHMSLELPSPSTYTRFAARVGGFEVGRDIRPRRPCHQLWYLGWQAPYSTTRSSVSLPQTSGTTSTFHTVPTSLLLEQTHPITEPHPQQDMPGHGTSSRHSSLYESRHPSPVPPPTSTPHREAVGETSDHPSGPRTVPLELLAGSSSQIKSSQSSSMRSQNQQDVQTEISQWSHPATPAQPLIHHDPLPPFPSQTLDHAPRSTSKSSQ